jgi:hypothetical protein
MAETTVTSSGVEEVRRERKRRINLMLLDESTHVATFELVNRPDRKLT